MSFTRSALATPTAVVPVNPVSARALGKYPFSSIPRPKRNILYYPVNSLKRGMSTVRTNGSLRPSLPGPISSLRVVPSKRYLSSAAKGASKLQHKWKWLALPAVTIILYTVYKKSNKVHEDQDDETSPLLGEDHKAAKPWQVQAYSTLPLKAISRLWGRFNDITLPVWMRTPGYKLYAYIFGANLDEMAEKDLTQFKNLGEFFYRELKPDARSIDEQAVLVSPSDGKVLHLGVIQDNQVEQVKGVTYSLDALLGTGFVGKAPSHSVDFSKHSDDIDVHKRDEEFAVMNGIHYTIDDLIGEEHLDVTDRGDRAVTPDSSSTNLTKVAKVTKDLFGPDFTPDQDKELFFVVIYLAPGDYHRFHSPANWVAQIRRHFIGELYSVAPYFQERLKGLLSLNERVSLLGKWRYGFFSMTPVGATNVGSIQINFDKDLRTNQKYAPDAPPESSESSKRHYKEKSKNGMCYEASYSGASKLLGGYPLVKGQEIGGFHLGSTVVLVFEAPKSFNFTIKNGDVVRMGQSIGNIN